MLRNKKVFSNAPPQTTKLDKHLKPVKTENMTERNDESEYMAIYETRKKPPPKLTKHEKVFD